MDSVNNSENNSLKYESLKRNFNLFKQSKIGILGLVIVAIFGLLALLQPFLFFTNIWDEATYHPVVGYDSQKIQAKVGKSYEPYRVFLRPLRDKMRITHRAIEKHLVSKEPLNYEELLKIAKVKKLWYLNGKLYCEG